MTAPTAAAPQPVTTRLLGVFLAGAAVAVALGVYEKVHDPTGEQPYTLFFTATINLKVWFATVAVALAIVQIVLAARLYGKIDWPWRGDTPPGSATPIASSALWPSSSASRSRTTVCGHSASSRPTPACSCTRCSAASSTACSRPGPLGAEPRHARLAAARRGRPGVRSARRRLPDEQPLVHDLAAVRLPPF